MIELSDDPNYPEGNPEEIPEANLEENPEQPVDENADGTGGQESVVMAETQKKQTADLINMLDELDEKGVPILKTAVATAEGKTVGVVGLPSFIREKKRQQKRKKKRRVNRDMYPKFKYLQKVSRYPRLLLQRYQNKHPNS